MKKLFFVLLFAAVLAGCKQEEKKSTPLPVSPPIPGVNTCNPNEWIASKTGVSQVFISGGFLHMKTQHSRVNGRQSITTASPACFLEGDFSIRVKATSIHLSDSLNGGACFFMLAEMAPGAGTAPKTVSVNLSNLTMSAGIQTPTVYKFLTENPLNTEISFTRKGSRISASIKSGQDSLSIDNQEYSTANLSLSFGIVSDTSAAAPSTLKIDELFVAEGTRKVITTNFSSGFVTD